MENKRTTEIKIRSKVRGKWIHVCTNVDQEHIEIKGTNGMLTVSQALDLLGIKDLSLTLSGKDIVRLNLPTLSQSTGRADKAGKEIFGDDVLSVLSPRRKEERYIVVWSREGWQCITRDGTKQLTLDEALGLGATNVGSVHDGIKL